MANSKITSLTALGAVPSAGDFFTLVDVSDTSMDATGTNKKLDAKYIMFTNGTANSIGTINVVNNGNSLVVGSGTNTSVHASFAATRGYFGYDGLNAIVQGGASKGIVFCVNNATFGSGSVAYFSSAGDFYTSGTIRTNFIGEGWNNLTYAGNWGNFGGSYSTGKYRKVGSRVVFTGMITGNTGTVATLPAGYRPPGYIRYGPYTNTGMGAIEIRTNGDIIYLSGGTSLMSLIGLEFDTI